MHILKISNLNKLIISYILIKENIFLLSYINNYNIPITFEDNFLKIQDFHKFLI